MRNTTRRLGALLSAVAVSTVALVVLAAPASARDYLYECDILVNGAPLDFDPITIPVTGLVNGSETVAVATSDTVSLTDVRSIFSISVGGGLDPLDINISEATITYPIPTGLDYVAASAVWSGADPTATIAEAGGALVVTTGPFTYTTGTNKTLGDLSADFLVTATDGEMPFIANGFVAEGTALGGAVTFVADCSTTDTGYFACAGIDVVCAAPPPPPTAPPTTAPPTTTPVGPTDDTLPRTGGATGADPAMLALGGLALACVGAGLVRLRRARAA